MKDTKRLAKTSMECCPLSFEGKAGGLTSFSNAIASGYQAIPSEDAY
ncbi:hypothetical protein Gohar_018362 [Gossypium harknessii]|uniref:Uncharacterized protein n=1 Tax=Gossypium harknessii TaxID=34285 RepID=A0A7J9G8X4_9ROSI|nr:hypothetical protein [Gossypium harknessii]